MGPITEPCGTPDNIFLNLEYVYNTNILNKINNWIPTLPISSNISTSIKIISQYKGKETSLLITTLNHLSIYIYIYSTLNYSIKT